MTLARSFPVLSWQVVINGYLVERGGTPFSRWQRLARCIASITIAFPANPLDRYSCPEDSLMRCSQSQFTLLFGKVLKSDMRVGIYNQVESNSNQYTDLTLLFKQDTI